MVDVQSGFLCISSSVPVGKSEGIREGCCEIEHPLVHYQCPLCGRQRKQN